MVSAGRQVPAIRFEDVRRRVDEVLPRTDVAAFVGFATAGPLDVPVRLETAAAFRDVFGPDVTLAASGEGVLTSHLGHAVEAFFANGGQVCWVVRVGRPSPPTRFALAGVVAEDAFGGWRTAELAARSPGSFADRYSVQPVVEVTPVPPSEHVAAGETVRVSYGDDLVRVAVTAEAADPRGDFDVAFERWFERAVPAAVTGAFRLTPSGRVPLDLVDLDVDGDAVVLELPAGERVEPGDVFVVDGPDGSFVIPVEEPPTPAGEGGSVPSGGAATVRLRVGACWRWTGVPSVPSVPPGPTRVERLTLTVAVYDGDELVTRRGGLGLARGHARFAGSLPTDETLFTVRANVPDGEGLGSGVVDRVQPVPSLWSDVESPRFPLAAAGSRPEVWLPLAAGLRPDPTRARPPVTDVTPWRAVERDGVAQFSEGLFLDPALDGSGVTALLDDAHAVADLGQPPRRLRGVHSLLPVDDVTIVAVPDAVHPGWELEDFVPVKPPAAPHLHDLIPDGDRHIATWSWLGPDPEYVVEVSPDPDFASARTVYEGPHAKVPLAGHGCSEVVHVRVRARLGRLAGPWSNTVSAWHPPAEFGECDALPEPLVLVPGDPLTWTPSHPSVELQSSADPGFDGAETVEATLPGAVVPLPGDAALYHRARVPGGPWSNTVTVDARPQRAWVAAPPAPAPAPAVLAVHRAVLRLAAARGDLFAVLAMPAGHDERDVATHVLALTGSTEERGVPEAPGDVLPLDRGEAAALTYGALYHPWVVERGGVTGDLRSSPPDGWVVGTVARRAIERGPWAAPANVPLAGVVGLTPPVEPSARRRLTEGGVNVLWREPRGFVVGTADTLSGDSLLRPIGTRRLLVLLRRLALRYGDTYVFAPHDAQFQAMVRAEWERHLVALFRRGAFAGDTPAEAFDLRADATVNPPASMDLGRFVVELGVAPSQPLEFVRVRVVSSGRRLTVEEVAA